MASDSGPSRPSLSEALFLGFAVASIGGPLALPTLLPGASGVGIRSAGLVVALALLVFAAPVALWWSWSRRVVSAGGLSAFVEDALGRRAALVHGWIWAFAYFLYLPYTITFVVYDLLAPTFPGIGPYRSALELLLPVAIVVTVLAPLRVILASIAALAIAQLGALGALAAVEYAHAPAMSFSGSPSLEATGRGVGGTALLFICASLPLYLAAEVRGGSRTVRRTLPAAVALVGAALLLSAAPLATVPGRLLNAPVPAVAVAQAYDGRGFAVIVGLLTAGSTLVLILAEYLALGRLLHWMHGLPLQPTLAWIGVPFVAADAVSLIDPARFYNDLLKPSLGALFVSQLVVFLAFPRIRRGPAGLALAGIAAALAAWGLYTLIAGSGST